MSKTAAQRLKNDEPIRVVTYARVSTLAQEKKGQSLPNQARAFAEAIGANGWTLVASYAESGSGGKDFETRPEFVRMLAEIPDTKPTYVLIDTLDRFTRSLKDGLNLQDDLAKLNIPLYPLDWDKAIDTENDSDWRELVAQFTLATSEFRKFRKRMRRAYAGRRERGATTCNKAPFGTRKDGDRLVPTADAEIVREATRMLLSGNSMGRTYAYMLAASPRVWKHRTSFSNGIGNPNYVAAGVRTQSDHDRLAAILAENATRFGYRAKYDHEFAGVFACATCGRRMSSTARTHRTGGLFEQVFCAGDDFAHTTSFSVNAAFRDGWRRYLVTLAASFDAWSAGEPPVNAERRLRLERELAAIDAEVDRHERRLAKAYDLMLDGDEIIAARSRVYVKSANAEKATMELRRQIVVADLAAVPPPERRNVDQMREIVNAIAAGLYDEMTIEKRGKFNRLVVANEGTFPVLSRAASGLAAISWPALDDLAADANANGTTRRAPRRTKGNAARVDLPA